MLATLFLARHPCSNVCSTEVQCGLEVCLNQMPNSLHSTVNLQHRTVKLCKSIVPKGLLVTDCNCQLQGTSIISSKPRSEHWNGFDDEQATDNEESNICTICLDSYSVGDCIALTKVGHCRHFTMTAFWNGLSEDMRPAQSVCKHFGRPILYRHLVTERTLMWKVWVAATFVRYPNVSQPDGDEASKLQSV